MKRFTYSCIAAIIFCITASFVVVGCKGTQANRAAYYTTDTIGSIVDKAMDAFSDYEVVKAKAALPADPSAEQVRAYISNQKEWQDVQAKHGQYVTSYRIWVSINATAASGTNVVAVINQPQFRDNAIKTAGQLTALIVQFVPSIQTVK